MPNPPAQTPCLYLDAGGADQFSKECLKALANCGFPAIGFGSYSQVLKAQGAARKSIAGEPFNSKSGIGKRVAGLPPEQQAFLANGESGHMATNSMYQSPGGRGDPCSNRPGCAGYDANAAPCTVHQGESTEPGSAHYQITQTEAGTARSQVGQPGCSNPDGSLTPQGTSNCVNATSQIAVQGGTADPNRPGSAAEAQRLSDVREQSAQSMASGQGQGASTSGGSSSDGASAGGSSADPTKPQAGGDGLSADQKKAIECMEEYWKKNSEKARKDFADKHRTTPQGSAQPGETPPDPPDAAQQAANAAQIRANRKAMEDMPVGSPERNALLAQNRDLTNDCREAQANYLSWYYDRGQSPPPMTPYPPGATPTPPDPGGSA